MSNQEIIDSLVEDCIYEVRSTSTCRYHLANYIDTSAENEDIAYELWVTLLKEKAKDYHSWWHYDKKISFTKVEEEVMNKVISVLSETDILDNVIEEAQEEYY